MDFEPGNSKFSEMKSIQKYSTNTEYLYAMQEDLADWLNKMYATTMTADTFFDSLENGVLICEHANQIANASGNSVHKVMYRMDAKNQTFHARDNIANFIRWCRTSVRVRECLMFETDDLILRKNEKNFILCLLEIARFGSKYGINVPTIIKFEQEIDDEIKNNNNNNDNNNDDSLPVDDEAYEVDNESVCSSSTKSLEFRSSEFSCEEPTTQSSMSPGSPASSCDESNDSKALKDLHRHVNKLVNKCTCQKQFQFTKLSEGKYRIGNTRNIVFIRILRNHIMVRVGGGWDTLENYLNKHDPCRLSTTLNCVTNCCHSQSQISLIKKQIQEQNNSNGTLSRSISPCISPLSTTSSKSKSCTDVKQSSNSNDTIYLTRIVEQPKQPLNTNDEKLTVHRDLKGKHQIIKDKNLHFTMIPRKYQAITPTSTPKSSQTTQTKVQEFLEKQKIIEQTYMNKKADKSPLTTIKNLINFTLPQHEKHQPSFPASAATDELLSNTPVYTETNLPPRLLKKIEKKTMVDLAKTINNIYQVPKQAEQNAEPSFSFNQNLQQTTSPKPPPRKPNKYKSKSKTVDINYDSLEEDGDSDSLSMNKSSRSTTTATSPSDISFDLSKSNTMFNRNLSIETPVNYSFCLNYLDNKNKTSPPATITSTHRMQNQQQQQQRPKWDKTQQSIDFFNNEAKKQQFIEKAMNTPTQIQKAVIVSKKDMAPMAPVIAATGAVKKPTTTSTTASGPMKPTAIPVPKQPRAVNQLPDKPYVSNMPRPVVVSHEPNPKSETKSQFTIEKEKLLEMKRIIDDKFHIPPGPKPAMVLTPATATKTTPRKVKKRSNERSATCGIVNDDDDDERPSTTKIPQPQQSRTPTLATTTRRTANVKPLAVITNKPRSKSAHEMVSSLEDSLTMPTDDTTTHNSRQRRDSIQSSSNSSTTNTTTDFKENKAFELRKSANLKMKIFTKQADPIYTRSHPVHTEIMENMNDQSRKRLFSKKNEQLMDQSQHTSSTTSNHTNESFVLFPNGDPNSMPKSRSTIDLIFNTQRTNSELDLFELMMNADNVDDALRPKGDSKQSVILLNKCNKPGKSIRQSNDARNRFASRNKRAAIVEQHKRSQSLPSYGRIPTINIVDFDE